METTWITLVNEILQTVVVPLMGVLTVFLIKVIREKMDAAAKDTRNETLAKYILMLKETVVDCVEATNQTFVDAIKASGEFTPEAQKAAFEKTLHAVTDIPSLRMQRSICLKPLATWRDILLLLSRLLLSV